MQLEFLGTGTSQGVPVITCECKVCTSKDPMDDRTRTSAIIRANDRVLLIDSGPDMRQQLLRAGVKRLDAVLLTHEHMDHVAGLDDLRAFNFKQRTSMDIYCNASTAASVKRVFHYAFDDNKYPGVPKLDLHLIDNEPFEAAGIKVIPVQVFHFQLPVFGFRIGDITYITDAKSIPEKEKDKIKGSKVLVLNALRKAEHISHLNLEEALGLVDELRPERAFFTHISHLMGTHSEISGELPDNVELAFDGLVVEC